MYSFTDWDKRFLDLAHHVSLWSKDPNTKVGAVIVNQNNQVLSLGYNGFPRGVSDDEKRYNDRATKLLFVAHAERNALDNAFIDVRGASLYSTLCPCNECAKSIIQRGIKKVFSFIPSLEKRTLFNVDITEQMFKEANVNFKLML